MSVRTVGTCRNFVERKPIRTSMMGGLSSSGQATRLRRAELAVLREASKESEIKDLPPRDEHDESAGEVKGGATLEPCVRTRLKPLLMDPCIRPGGGG